MLQLYTFATPNGHKASIALEELGIPYEVHVVDIRKGDQHKPEFLAINPNNKIPAIVDPDGPGGRPLTLFESGAILVYLADRTGKLMPREGPERYHTLQWIMFQMGGVGPMFGQLNHFARYTKEKIPYAIERYTRETERLLEVLDGALRGREYLTGTYSMADIANFTWVESTGSSFPELVKPHANVRRWLRAVGERPAVRRGLAVPKID